MNTERVRTTLLCGSFPFIFYNIYINYHFAVNIVILFRYMTLHSVQSTKPKYSYSTFHAVYHEILH